MSWEIEGPDIIGDNVWHASSFEGKGEHGKAVFFTPTEGSRGEVEVHLDDVGLADDGIVYNGVLDLRDPNDHLEFVERLGKRFPDIDWTEPLDLIRRSGKFGGAMTVAELLAATPDRTPWCCEGLVAPGLLTVMVADPKAGKTQFAIGLGGAGLTEGAFAGREARFGPRFVLDRVHRLAQRDAVHVHDVLRQGWTLVGHAEGLVVLLRPPPGWAVAVVAVGVLAQVAAPVRRPGPQLRGTGAVGAAGDGAGVPGLRDGAGDGSRFGMLGRVGDDDLLAEVGEHDVLAHGVLLSLPAGAPCPHWGRLPRRRRAGTLGRS